MNYLNQEESILTKGGFITDCSETTNFNFEKIHDIDPKIAI